MRLPVRFLFFLLGLTCAVKTVSAQTANFTATPVTGCAPLVVTFTSTSSGATSYNWTFGNGNTSTFQNPATTYVNPGTYTVTLTINNGASTTVKTNYITVYAAPTVSFTASNTSGCIPLLSSFNGSVTPNSPGAVIYSWYYGDGSPLGSGLNSTHMYTAPNTYTVTLTAKNGAGCTGSATQTAIITANPKPGGTFLANATYFCRAPATVAFTNTATSNAPPYTVWWDFGDGTTGNTSNNPTHTYNTSGTFTVRLVTKDANGCVDTMVKTNYINIHAPNASFAIPAVTCIPRGYDCSDTAIFRNTTPGGSNATWDFGDGSTGSGDTVGHVFCLPASQSIGTFTVRMITQSAGCSDTAFRTVTVRRATQFSILYGPQPHNCKVPATFSFTTSPTSIATKWTWSSGGTDTGAAVTKYYTNSLVDTVHVIATDIHGCKDTVQDTIPIYNPDPFIIGPNMGCAPFTAGYRIGLPSNLSLPFGPFMPDTITSWNWSFGDGSSNSNDSTPVHTYTNPGTYTLAVTIMTKHGCTYSDTINVYVGTKINPTFTAYPNPVCAGQQVYFQNTTGVPASSTVTYTWDVGDGAYTPVNNSDAVHIYVIPGVYTVKLISNNNGCTDTTVKVNWMVVNGPNANFVNTVLCDSNHRLIQLTNMSIGATSQLWIFSDNTTDTSFSPYHVFPANGTYTVTLTTYNSTTGCRDTLSLPVTVGMPVLNVTSPDTTICKGDTLRLRPLYSGPTGAAVNVYVTNGIPVTGPPALNTSYFVMNTTGYQTVTVTSHLNFSSGGAISGGCTDTFKKLNYVLVSKPVALFKSSPLLGCTPLNVVLTDTSIYTPGALPRTRIWTIGNGTPSTSLSAAISNTILTAGKYTVKLVVADTNGCKDSLTKTDYIEARHPTAKFGVNRNSACLWQPLSFTDSSIGVTRLTYRWDFGDGTKDTAKNPTHAYTSIGSYTVRLIVTDSTGCSDTMTKVGYITTSKPTASFTMSDSVSVCPPLSINFVSTSVNAAGLDWTFGNSAVSVLPTPTSLYTAPGIYRVRLIATNSAGCKDTAFDTVRILGYAGAINYPPAAGCAPLTVTFSANLSNVPRVVWDFANGDTALATGPTITYTYNTPGAYVPKLIFYDAGGCSASSVGLDTIKVDAVYADFKVLPPCEKTTVQLVDNSRSLFSSVTNWRWEFGPGQIATGQTVSRIYPAPGMYPVKLIVTNSRGCTDTLEQQFRIYPLPVITGSPDTTVCPPDALPLWAKGGVSYTWSPASSLSCIACDSPRATPTVATAYIVTGTDSMGCQNKDTIRIGMQSKTTFVVTAGGEICQGQQFRLWATGATTYNWTPTTGLTNPDSATLWASPTVTTTYVATGREGSCLADTHMVKVIVNPLPSVDAGSDERIIAGNSVALQASGTGIDHLEWKGPDSLGTATLSCTTCYGPFASPRATTVYKVIAYSNKGCIAVDSVTVRVLCDGSQLFIPNTFTPNGDGVNDFFFPRGRGLDILSSFRVYSRWGELLYEKQQVAVNDEYAGWNGTHKGQKLAPDVYVYIIEATCDNGQPIMWKGDVTLMR